MAVRSVSRDGASLVDWRSASAIDGGTTITADTPLRIVLPDGTHFASVMGHNFTTAVVLQWNTCPYLSVLVTKDDLATVDDVSKVAQDGLSATIFDLDSLPTLALGGFLLIGSPRRIRGLDINLTNFNTTPSVLLVEYWNGAAWVDLSATDGTDVGGDTLGQDGLVTWALPAIGAWKRKRARELALPVLPPVAIPSIHATESWFWTRWSVSVALDTDVTVAGMIALAEFAPGVGGAETLTDQVTSIYAIKGIGGVAAVEADVDAGSGDVVVNVAAGQNGFDG